MSRNGARTAEQKDARRYVRGEPAAFATLVLNGKLSVLAGVDGFRAEAGPWTVLGADALVSDEGSFVPDFSAHVATDSVRCIYVTRAEYFRRADSPWMGRGGASAATRIVRRGIFRGDESRRRRGCDADIWSSPANASGTRARWPNGTSTRTSTTDRPRRRTGEDPGAAATAARCGGARWPRSAGSSRCSGRGPKRYLQDALRAPRGA